MDQQSLSANVQAIRQAFSYVNRFAGQIFVVKIADTLVSHTFFPLLIRDLVLLHRMGIRIALVPGARSRIDQILQTFGIGWETHGGTRISPPEAMQYVKMAASDVANGIMTLLAENNATAVVGNWVRARGIGVRNGIDFQSSGLVESVQTDVVMGVIASGLIPIFPNVGWNASGKPYNISSNQLALTVATELKAAKLFFVTDLDPITAKRFRAPDGVEGADDSVLSVMTGDQADAFVKLNNAATGAAEVEIVSLAVDACRAGVARVHVVDGRVEGALLKEIFSNRGIGTMVYANQHANVRSMTKADIPDVLAIMQPSVEAGRLVPRTAEYLESALGDFVVYDVDGTVHGCGALHSLTARQGEIAALVVDEAYGSKGIGKRITTHLLERAHTQGLSKVFVLTTQTADWFSQLGFRECAPDNLPKNRRATYDTQRRSRVLLYDLHRSDIARRLSAE